MVLTIGRSSQHSSVYTSFSDEYKNKEKEMWYFGELIQIDNTIIIPFLSTQYFSRKEATATRNYLFVNAKTNSSSWLFNHNKFVISKFKYIDKNEIIKYSSLSNKSIALYFTVNKQDTNGDGAIKSNDNQTISLIKLDGSNYTEIEQDISFVKDSAVIDDGNSLLLFYEKKEKVYLSKYSLIDFKKITDIKIAGNSN
ncbi:MAG: hypothetical protein QM487_11630 [Candidatus Marithrix sp.]